MTHSREAHPGEVAAAPSAPEQEAPQEDPRIKAAMMRRALQRKSDGGAEAISATAHRVADKGVGGQGAALPHLEKLQQSFGPEHDLSSVRSHVGGQAAEGSRAIGARAYTTGGDVAFKE